MKKRKLFFVLLFLIMMIGVGTMGVKAAGNNEAYMISTGPGADVSNSMTITWHSEVDGSFLLYVKKDVDPNFTDPFVKFPESTPIEHFDTKTGITHRVNKCVVRLDSLDSGTEYLYKAGKSTFSSVHSFKTASNNESFSFLYISDYHVYNPVATRLQKAENIYTEANKVEDIAFTVHGGDVVAYGSSYDYWESLMGANFATNSMMAMTPGNHDFYNGSASTVGVGYFNNILTNPDNGADGVKNSSYYFRYNNVLFVSIDNESSTQSNVKLAAQQAWFRKVMEENPSQYIITYNHRPFYNGSTGNAGHAQTNRTNWSSLFDEYGVDLVLSGHDHVFVRTKKTYNGAVSLNEKLGTVYINSPQIGDRPNDANPNNPYTNFDAHIGGNYSGGVIITINPNNFKTKLITDTGQILDSSSNSAKREPINYSVENKQEVINNLSIAYDHVGNRGIVSLKDNDYLYVKSIKVLKNASLVIDKKIGVDDRDVIIANPTANTIQDYNIEITFNDDTVLSKILTLKATPPYGTVTNVSLAKEEELNYLSFQYNFSNRQVTKYKVFANDNLLFEEDIVDGVGVKKVYLEDIEKGIEYNIRLEIIDRLEEVVFSKELTLFDPIIDLVDFSVNVLDEVFAGDNLDIEIVASPVDATYQDYSYISSNPLVLSIDDFGVIKALIPGEVVLTIKEITSGIEKIVNIVVTKKDLGTIGELEVIKDQTNTLNIPYHFINNQVKKLDIYLDEVLLKTLDITDGEGTKYIDLGKFVATKDYKIKVEVIDIFDDVAISEEMNYLEPAILVSDLEVTYKAEMIVGENQTLGVLVIPADASFKEVVYLSENADIISVSKTGKLVALKKGEATIKISIKDSEFTKSITITVSEKVTSIKVTAPEEIKLGTKTDAVVIVEITPNIEAKVTYSSSDDEILSIDETGKITPKKAGEVTITVTVDEISETVTVKVLKKSGCASGATMLALLPMAFAIVFFRRKKV